ncbi:MAG: hypothetical protein M3331_03015 [Actinomycetota bacterium]|nr:hypothetical protein [Actinomycetota bacterium]
MALHPAENRGYRELMLTAEEARTRLRRIAGHLHLENRAVADRGSEALGEMLDAMKPALAEHDLHGEVAARGAGARIGSVRAEILDRFLERNQALRYAIDDVEHVATLLAYMGAVSTARGKKNLPELCGIWERKLRRQVSALRKTAVELGSRPDDAIEPLDPTPVEEAERSETEDGGPGEAVDGAAVPAGAVGEAAEGAAMAQEETGLFARATSDSNDESGDAGEASEEPKKRGGFFRRG